MSGLALRLRRELEDTLTVAPAGKRLRYAWHLARAGLIRGDAQAARYRRIEELCAAVRASPSYPAPDAAQARLAAEVAAWPEGPIDWPALVSPPAAGIRKGLVLKAPGGDGERGVVYVIFEREWLRFLHQSHDLEAFARRYQLIVATSWSPPHVPIVALFGRHYPAEVLVRLSNLRDLETLPRLSPRLVPIPILSSMFVNPAQFAPRPFAERDVDILMVANWGKFKRHHLFFRALRTMPSELRIVLVGQDETGRTSADIEAEAAAYGVAGRCELLSNRGFDEVVELYGRAKVCLLLSQREGSPKCVAESLFGDCPIGMLAGADNGSMAFVNEQTGRLLRERHLAEDVMAFLRDAGGFRARDWALANIACQVTSGKLNNLLRERAQSLGEPWTQDITPLHHNPDPAYLDPADADRLAPAYAELRDEYGIWFSRG